jgi:hypothetical protein
MLIQGLLERGNGAARQRRAAEDRGARGAVRLLADETMGDAKAQRRFARRPPAIQAAA